MHGTLHFELLAQCSCVGLARTIYIRCIYGIVCRDCIECRAIYSVYIRFWPTLFMCATTNTCEHGS